LISTGVIGAGNMGRYHGGILSRQLNACVVAVADTSAERAQSLADALGCRVAASAAELIESAEIDAVVVTTPTAAHRLYVEAAANAGKHIFCEKPLARTMKEGEAMIAAAERAGVKMSVGHVVRWFPQYEQIRRSVLDGTIGKPGTARVTRGASFPRATNDWYADYEQSGGVMLDMVIHDLDWLLWTFGPVRRVFARRIEGQPGYDGGMISLRHESGVISYAEGNWSYPSGFYTSVEVAGDDGLLMGDNTSTSPLRMDMREDGVSGAAVEVPTGGSRSADPYELELRDWLGWIAGGPPPRCTATDALDALRVALAALESAETRQPVELNGGGR